MSNKDLAQGIRAMRKHVKALSDESRHSPADQQPRLEEALEELRTSIEELQVAEEELRVQNDALIQTRIEVEAERQRYHDLFEFAPDGYIVTSVAGVIREANQATASILSINRKFLIGKPFFNFIAEEDRSVLRSKLNELSQTKVTPSEEIEVPIRSRSGEMRQIAISLAPVLEQDEKLVAYRWILRDITQRKQVEEEVKSLNAELEQRVVERTAQLEAANREKDESLAREQQARAEAEAANKSKDEFLATLSHELRTPLNAILGWTHILRTHLLDHDKAAHAVEVIDRNAKGQAQIVDDILEVSRIITGNLHMKRETLSLKPVIEAALDSVQHSADEKQISITSSLDPAVGFVSGDPLRLQQVVLNLLSNAIKFTPGGGSVHVRLERVNNSARISVSDTGEGIKSDFLPYIFERFRQAESASTRRYGGMGLGLSIAHHIVKMHEGMIRAESGGEAKGTTIVVDLPLIDRGRPATEEVSQPRPAIITPFVSAEPRLNGVWVVVIDDEPDAREMIKVIMEQWGARVTALATVAEVIDALAGEANGQRPDVLVADIAMPEEDGFDLIRKVRKLKPERGGTIPAIALTAYAAKEDRLRTLSEGYHLHLSKPVSLIELASAVESFAGRGKDN
jgi:PAS domain S-box-containing protein